MPRYVQDLALRIIAFYPFKYNLRKMPLSGIINDDNHLFKFILNPNLIRVWSMVHACARNISLS